MAQLQAFLHQSQAVMSPKPPPSKSGAEVPGSGSASRKAGGSKAAGASDQSLRASLSVTGANGSSRRGVLPGTGRSSSQPQLHLPAGAQLGPASDAGPSTSRSRNGGGMARISSLQALVEVATAAFEEDGNGANCNSSMLGTDSAGEDDMGDDKILPGDDGDVKRLKRKQSNRESARRSRLKKQAEADALTRATSELQAENSALRAALTASQGLMQKLVQEKAGLIGQVRNMGGEVPSDLEWQVPVIRMPPHMQHMGH